MYEKQKNEWINEKNVCWRIEREANDNGMDTGRWEGEGFSNVSTIEQYNNTTLSCAHLKHI